MNETPPPAADETPDETPAPSALEALLARVSDGVLGRADPLGSAQSGKAVQTLAAIAIARLGTKSLRGATLVSAGLIAKALFDRSQSRRAGRGKLPK